MDSHSASSSGRNRLFWPSRAAFVPGTTRRQRQAQYRSQINALVFVGLAAVIFGLVAVWINYQGAGSSKTVSCDEFPHYCVPLAGGSSDPAFADNETASSRTLDGTSQGVPGVVRGITDDTMPFIGDPAAPVEFVVVSAYSCSHCQAYHEGDLEREITDFALSGQATFRSVLIPRYEVESLAIQATLCAGAQGAYWEMTNTLYHVASAESITSAFTVPRLKGIAQDMGLDGEKLVACISSGRYQSAVEKNRQFANDLGVTGTPTVLMRQAGSDQWTPIGRGYETIKGAVAAAQP